MAIGSSPAAGARRGSLTWAIVLIGLIPLIGLPTLWSLKPVWTHEARSLAMLALGAAAYLLTAAVLTLGEARNHRGTLWRVFSIGAAAFMPVLLAVFAFHPQFSRFAALALPAIGFALLVWAFTLRRWPAARLAVAVLVALASIGVQVGIATGRIARSEPQPRLDRARVESSLYELAVEAHRYVVPQPKTQQGGIALLADRYVLATGDGDLYLFERPAAGRKLTLQRLVWRVPLNAAEFTAAMQGVPVPLAWFRVSDVFARQTAKGVRLFASHHHWNDASRCFTMRVSTLEGTQAQFESGAAAIQWRTLFETSPCMPVVTPGKAPRFGGLENGGRMALLDDGQLLLAVGDHAIDGWGTPVKAAQDPNGSYGKILAIDLESGASRIYSSGHRNPQGLYRGPSGLIWSTEHGPQGGDELNLVREGANYGWPLATYGTDYDTHAWPLTAIPGSHDGAGFTQPYYVWVPSIGVSTLVEMDSSKFPFWQGDLLVGSLTNRNLWRVRVRDSRVVLTEPILIGERIRDMVQGHHGELVLWTDRESVMFVEPAPPTSAYGAKQLFRVCAACHVPPQGQEFAVGPNLEGVVGRRVASLDGFDYSPALRAAGGVWTRERLDAFLANPAAAAPGTIMMFPGIAEPGTRRALIEYLASPDSDLKAAPGGGEL